METTITRIKFEVTAPTGNIFHMTETFNDNHEIYDHWMLENQMRKAGWEFKHKVISTFPSSNNELLRSTKILKLR